MARDPGTGSGGLKPPRKTTPKTKRRPIAPPPGPSVSPRTRQPIDIYPSLPVTAERPRSLNPAVEAGAHLIRLPTGRVIAQYPRTVIQPPGNDLVGLTPRDRAEVARQHDINVPRSQRVLHGVARTAVGMTGLPQAIGAGMEAAQHPTGRNVAIAGANLAALYPGRIAGLGKLTARAGGELVGVAKTVEAVHALAEASSHAAPTRISKATAAVFERAPERRVLRNVIDEHAPDPVTAGAAKEHIDAVAAGYVKEATRNGQSRREATRDFFRDAHDQVAPTPIESFHGYPEKRTSANLRSRLNPRNASRGIQQNEPIYQLGQHVLGPITPQAWVKRVKTTMPTAAERAKWARWYTEVWPLFQGSFGDDAERVLRGFAVSQANASPTSGLAATLRVIDKVDRGVAISKKEISAVVKSIEQAVKGDGVVEKGVAAKLSDFVDSLLGHQTRAWMGYDPRGGAPAAIDIHALRDLGWVDPRLVERLDKRGLVKGRDYVLDSRGVAEGPTYEQAQRQYQAITDHLNRIKFDGRDDWLPAEVQAVGWASIQKFHGSVPEDLTYALRRNTRSFVAPHANAEAISNAVTDEGGFLTEVGDGYVSAIISPEVAARAAQRIADEHGQVRVLWLNNQSKARVHTLSVDGEVTPALEEQLKAAGFTHIYETPTGHMATSEGRVNYAKARSAVESNGLRVTSEGKRQQEVFNGRAGRSYLPGGGAEGVGSAGRGRPDVSFTEAADPSAFLAELQRNTRAWNLTEHSLEELQGSRVFLSQDGKAGYAISPEGDLQNVFNNGSVPGAGKVAVAHAIENGARTLDAYDGYLPPMYRRFGFNEVGRMKFVDEYAPPGWDYEKFGRPDIVFMGFDAPETQRAFFTDWDAAKAAALEASQAPVDLETAVPSGHVRLYRGEREKSVHPGSDPDLAGRWYTDDLRLARGYAGLHRGENGRVFYVDVPASDAKLWETGLRHGFDDGTSAKEFALPSEIAVQRQPITAGESIWNRLLKDERGELNLGAFMRRSPQAVEAGPTPAEIRAFALREAADDFRAWKLANPYADQRLEREMAARIATHNGVDEWGLRQFLATGEIKKATSQEEAVAEAMPAMQRLRAKQDKLVSVERGRRATAAQVAYDQAGGGEAGHIASLRALEGEMPRLTQTLLDRQVLSDEGIHELFQFISTQQHLGFYEQLRARKSLIDLTNGVTLQPNQIKLLNGLFGPVIPKAVQHSVQSIPGAILNEFWNLPRSLMASLDLSAPFRQGLVSAAGHPRLFARNFVSMFKALSKTQYRKMMDEIIGRDSFDLMMQAKLALPDITDKLTAGEVYFFSNLGMKIPLVAASQRAYLMFLNKMRADVFDSLVRTAEAEGIDLTETVGQTKNKRLKDIAHYVNVATGRGDLDKIIVPIKLEKAAEPLAKIFFAPRLWASRLNLLDPRFYASLDPFVRKQALRSALTLLGAGSTVAGLASLAGAKVSLEPRSADFGKIRIGNSRLDIWGGFQQNVRFISQFGSGTYISSTTGKRINLGEGGYGKMTRFDVAERFARGKSSPTMSVLWDWMRGQTYNREKVDFKTKETWLREIKDHTIPLLWQDMNDVQDEYGPAGVIGLSLPGTFGIGVQTYNPKPPPRRTPHVRAPAGGMGGSFGAGMGSAGFGG